VHDIQPADVFNASNNLLEESTGLLLLDPLYLHNVVEKLASTCIFHNKIEFFLRLNDFIKLYNLRVSNDLENVNFSGNSLNIRHIANFAFFKNFNSDFFLSQGVSA
jgi:hypothetical protein